MIKSARDHEVPIIVDPKGVDFTKYSHSTLIKPNYKEAYAQLLIMIDQKSDGLTIEYD